MTKQIQVFGVQVILIKEIVATIETFPVVSEARNSLFVELRKAAEFHEVEAGTAALVFNQGGTGEDEACRPKGQALCDHGLIEK
jgi:hypothetical protein